MAIQHIYPLWEEAVHSLTGTDCLCNPTVEQVEGGTIVSHNVLTDTEAK